MKKNIMIKGLAGVLVASAIAPLASCKSDYLDLTPITSLSAADVGKSFEGANAALAGASAYMYHQMGDLNYNNQTGESWMVNMYGEALGGDEITGIWSTYGLQCMNWNWLRVEKQTISNMLWKYCYGLIAMANGVIGYIPALETNGQQEALDKACIEASALVLRCNGYLHLLQAYAPRWEDSNNGNKLCLIKRLSLAEEGDEFESDRPFVSMNEILDQCYKDLNKAIAAFEAAGNSWTPNANYIPGIRAAYGMLARIAMIKHDWPTARDNAKKARAGVPIMSAADYQKGFIHQTPETLWGSMYQGAGIYYWSFAGMHSCTGNYTRSWQIVDGINLDLARKFPLSDIRSQNFFTPEFASTLKQYGDVKVDDFFDDDNMTVTGYPVLMTSPLMRTMVVSYGYDRFPAGFTYGTGTDQIVRGGYAANNGAKPNRALTEADCQGNVQMGAQFKFWGTELYGVSSIPWMRASEMGYIEAEAEFMLKNETRARAIMVELNKDVRDPNFTCTETSDALLTKIQDYKRFELWGEGFCWFEMKRWNLPIVRRAWKAGDPTSGSFTSFYGGDSNKTLKTTDAAGWWLAVPEQEFIYNKAANRDDLPDRNQPAN